MGNPYTHWIPCYFNQDYFNKHHGDKVLNNCLQEILNKH